MNGFRNAEAMVVECRDKLLLKITLERLETESAGKEVQHVVFRSLVHHSTGTKEQKVRYVPGSIMASV